MNPHIGLVPFYLKLYDDIRPAMRAEYEAFIERIADGFRRRNVTVSIAPVCRVAEEFDRAITELERDRSVDALVSLHLAYSPSLESIEAFCRTPLPLILLDTTMDAAFGLDVPTERISYNHGIHGVMDFACMLRRRRRPFEILAGHDSDPALLDRAAAHVRAAVAARELHRSRALRVGPTFAGMGDFSVSESVLHDRFGITCRETDLSELDAAIRHVTEEDVDAEWASDQARFDCDLEPEDHRRSLRVGLGLRRLIDEAGYTALSVNFQAFDRSDRPADTMPFLEISKAMARGIGYGGEGDVLTASLVGALARGFDAVTFTEIFCPDWTGNQLFLSHMGEISPAVAAGRARIFTKPSFLKGARDPAVLTCAVKPGPAVYVNLAPGPDDQFSLIVAPVEVQAETDALAPGMRNTVRAWIRPALPAADFLEAYGRAGGTHHSALVLGDVAEAVCAFGRAAGVTEVVNIQ